MESSNSFGFSWGFVIMDIFVGKTCMKPREMVDECPTQPMYIRQSIQIVVILFIKLLKFSKSAFSMQNALFFSMKMALRERLSGIDSCYFHRAKIAPRERPHLPEWYTLMVFDSGSCVRSRGAAPHSQKLHVLQWFLMRKTVVFPCENLSPRERAQEPEWSTIPLPSLGSDKSEFYDVSDVLRLEMVVYSLKMVVVSIKE